MGYLSENHEMLEENLRGIDSASWTNGSAEIGTKNIGLQDGGTKCLCLDLSFKCANKGERSNIFPWILCRPLSNNQAVWSRLLVCSFLSIILLWWSICPWSSKSKPSSELFCRVRTEAPMLPKNESVANIGGSNPVLLRKSASSHTLAIWFKCKTNLLTATVWRLKVPSEYIWYCRKRKRTRRKYL